MRTTTEGQELIKSFESCALAAFWDKLGKVWTIGWGRTRGVREGDTCTQDQADTWFLEDLAEFELLVSNCVGDDTLSPNQFSAIVMFCYNVGLGYPGQKDGFKVLKSGEPSTMLKRIRVRDFAGAAAEFPKWDHVGGAECAGILRRRMAEQALFLKERSKCLKRLTKE